MTSFEPPLSSSQEIEIHLCMLPHAPSSFFASSIICDGIYILYIDPVSRLHYFEVGVNMVGHDVESVLEVLHNAVLLQGTTVLL